MAEATSNPTPLSRQVHIYALHDLDGRLRYVGKTVFKLTKRLREHVCEAKRGRRCRRSFWIRQQMRLGHAIGIELLETIAPDADWQSREQHWIKTLRAQGYDLTNLTDGGEGLHGHRFSAEHRAKIGAKSSGRKKLPEELKKLSLANRGRKVSPEARAKISAAHKGRKLSHEHKAKIAAKSLGRHPRKESILKMSRSHKGSICPDHVRDMVSKRFRGKKKSSEHRKAISQAKMRPVFKLDLEGRITEKFESVIDAASSLGVYHYAIVAALQWPGRSCKGFKWMYCDQLPEPKLWGNLPAYEPRKRGRPSGSKTRFAEAGHPADFRQSSNV